jgi:hypothetical protein
MSTPLNPMLVAIAISELGGKADLQAIYKRFATDNPDLVRNYKDRASLEATIRATIQNHCPQSESYREGTKAFFEKIARGKYRIVPMTEQPNVIEKGRRI